MDKPKIYIDGQAGTTGLEIYQRLSKREDIEIILIDPEKRKDDVERKKCMDKADLVFLCLPDAASIAAIDLLDENTKVIDASTAHRCNDDWAYGMCELSDAHKHKIETSHRVANPGCHATGFIMAVYPLVQKGLIDKDSVLVAHSLTGYSGGGNKMIAQYENDKTEDLYAPRIYGLTQMHKHLPEMKKMTGLNEEPIFNPIVDDYYRGMAVTVPVFNHSIDEVYEVLKNWYEGKPLITVSKQVDGMISANTKANKDSLELIVSGNDKKACITTLFDNLGKGACGAAIQNMNLMLGFDQTKGLDL
ncbi:MAG: N-acetyl-gamma-glutamyl-phosphate reductase [Holdemanella sp.]|nr:N-acetyl-gamma-glutamyl-phosphate reductase [Holdemanella sp.]